jgi:hypothetical protein
VGSRSGVGGSCCETRRTHQDYKESAKKTESDAAKEGACNIKEQYQEGYQDFDTVGEDEVC